MSSLADEIRDIIAGSPLVEEGLAQGIINLSALARRLQPELETRLKKSVEPGTIMMALRRAQPAIRRRSRSTGSARHRIGDLTVRSNLAELTYRSSSETLACLQALLHRAKDLGSHFMTFTQGLFETTIVTSAGLVGTVEEAFADEELIVRLEDLAAVVIRLPEETVHQPGVHYGLLKQLAWNGLNVVEVVSTYTELTVVFARADVDRAFSVLMHYLSPV
jgi:hypothetical protein